MNDHAPSGRLDIGTGFGRKAPTYLAALTEVGPGTPMGELLRRYWHPVGLASHATATPREVRVLGEDLILFRDKTGRAGLRAIRAARIAAPRSTTARSRSAASAAAITAGCSTSRAAASSSRASRKAAGFATACASPGTRCANNTA